MQAVMENKESTLPGLMKIKAGNEESAMNDLTQLSSIIFLQANLQFCGGSHLIGESLFKCSHNSEYISPYYYITIQGLTTIQLSTKRGGSYKETHTIEFDSLFAQHTNQLCKNKPTNSLG